MKNSTQVVVLYDNSPIGRRITEGIKGGRIPLTKTSELTLLDNRICCSYARRGARMGPRMCGHFYNGVCFLGNGKPCVFDEPSDAEIWERINEQKRLAAEAARDREEG